MAAKKKAVRKAAAKSAAKQTSITLPVLGKGEKYRGITLHEDRLAHLIELPGEFNGSYADAQKWAKEQGGELPSRIEGILLFKRARSEYQRDWYWLGEQPAGDEGYAWYQNFDDGYQGWNPVYDHSRARAVRRVSIR